MNEKKILCIVAHTGFQPIEYEIPLKLLENAGYSVLTASNKPGKATDSQGTSISVDTTIGEIQGLEDFHALIITGGPGTLENLDNETTYTLLDRAQKSDLIIGAICLATRILAHAGILKNRRATGWNGDQELLGIYQQYQVIYKDAPVIVDKHIVTASGPDAAREFAENIISLLAIEQDK